MKKLLTVLLAILMVVSLAGCGTKEVANKDRNAADKDGNYHIAVCLPFTGKSQSYAEYIKWGIEISLKQLEANGWLNGDGTGKIIVDYMDDTDTPTEGASLAEKIVSSEEPFYLLEIGSFRSDVSLACVETYKEAEFPQYALTSSHKDFLPSSGDWGFSLSMTQDIAAARVAAYDIQHLGFKKIALICSNDSWGNETKQYYTEYAAKFGATLVTTEMYETGTQDFTSILTKIKGLEPELVMCFCAETDIVLMRKQAKTVGLECTWQVSSKSRTSNVLKGLVEANDEDVIANQYGIYAQTANMSNPVYKAYYDLYMAEHPGEKSTQKYADQGYNCMLTIIWAMQEVLGAKKDVTRQSFRDKLATLNGLMGVQGELTFAEGRKILQIQYLSKIVKDETTGEWKWVNYEDLAFDADEACGFKK